MINKCLNCNKCCEWNGILVLSQQDITRLSKYLNIENQEFLNTYSERRDNDLILKSDITGSCVFLNNGSCSIYPARPTACIEFPRMDQITDSLRKYCNYLRFIDI